MQPLCGGIRDRLADFPQSASLHPACAFACAWSRCPDLAQWAVICAIVHDRYFDQVTSNYLHSKPPTSRTSIHGLTFHESFYP
jgi:hypothetical protein